eukprot:TRINITY_DN4173_c0_g1_i1.p1 TRINITY_DN4173_c0_g1~~TRINITY_DN4173_c0_g1_i1.p1  ORF type:complete len:460 (+),score=101.02 TRINITY_DN4173_c0_g1_i1:81-1460(+)
MVECPFCGFECQRNAQLAYHFNNDCRAYIPNEDPENDNNDVDGNNEPPERRKKIKKWRDSCYKLFYVIILLELLLVSFWAGYKYNNYSSDSDMYYNNNNISMFSSSKLETYLDSQKDLNDEIISKINLLDKKFNVNQEINKNNNKNNEQIEIILSKLENLERSYLNSRNHSQVEFYNDDSSINDDDENIILSKLESMEEYIKDNIKSIIADEIKSFNQNDIIQKITSIQNLIKNINPLSKLEYLEEKIDNLQKNITQFQHQKPILEDYSCSIIEEQDYCNIDEDKNIMNNLQTPKERVNPGKYNNWKFDEDVDEDNVKVANSGYTATKIGRGGKYYNIKSDVIFDDNCGIVSWKLDLVNVNSIMFGVYPANDFEKVGSIYYLMGYCWHAFRNSHFKNGIEIGDKKFKEKTVILTLDSYQKTLSAHNEGQKPFIIDEIKFPVVACVSLYFEGNSVTLTNL